MPSRLVGDLLRGAQSLPTCDRGSILPGWQLVRSNVQIQLTTKLIFTRVIRVLACGIMRPKEHISRSIAQECVRQFDQSPDPLTHHRKSVRMTSKDLGHGDGTCYWIYEFVYGCSREDLGQQFWLTVGVLKLFM